MQRLKRQSSSHNVSGLSSSPGPPPPLPPPPSLLFFLGDILFTIFITRSTLSIPDDGWMTNVHVSAVGLADF
ncbi:hypothetical protein D9C73_005147 [Collichthys lucidus]|uniref:Uncharacterized protein n=1 Tax=Collichthys lucidus TaxID=240159 RepID=A0A4V6XYI6_COLLU|nr:hypothetical protein D9C73_005147 [Collichthys lucidus]